MFAALSGMDRVPLLNIFGLPEPIVPSENASQIRFDAAKKKALANPLILGQFLSEDAETTLLLINFDQFYIESDEDCIGRLRKTAENAAREVGVTDMEFSVTGWTPLDIAYMQTNEASLLKYQIIGYGIIFIMALVLFRGLSSVLIVAAAPILGVYWTLGILPYFEVQDNPFNNVILPVLISLVGLTDGVHLMVHIRKLRSEGLSTKAAALEGVREVGLACALTSLTTRNWLCFARSCQSRSRTRIWPLLRGWCYLHICGRHRHHSTIEFVLVGTKRSRRDWKRVSSTRTLPRSAELWIWSSTAPDCLAVLPSDSQSFSL